VAAGIGFVHIAAILAQPPRFVTRWGSPVRIECRSSPGPDHAGKGVGRHASADSQPLARHRERSNRLSGLFKRSFSLAGHRTSVALEPEFWAALTVIAAARGQSLSALVSATDADRDPTRPLASALRVLALRETGRLRDREGEVRDPA
jgi:predicted DNA-binding ribbon-helix-helix protein